MTDYQFIALILALVGPVLALARWAGLPPSLTLFALGVGSAFLPDLPRLRADPQLLLDLLLPPLAYASTVRISLHLLRFNARAGLLHGALIVLATVLLVALTARALLPGLAWSSALLLGVIASIFDTQLFHEAEGRPHVPRALADILKAREVVSRLFILASLAMAIEVAQARRPVLWAASEHYLLDVVLGLALGALLGQGIAWLRKRIDPAPIEIAVSMTTPFMASLAATALGVSSIACITAAALVISTVRIDRRSGRPISSAETRISAVAFWEEASLLISSLLFFLAGRALPEALSGVSDWMAPQLLLAGVALLGPVVAVQFAFSWLSVRRGRARAALARTDRGPAAPAAAAAVMAWSSTRSVLGLVIALSVPAALPDGTPVPDRDLILVVAALMILASVLIQGLSLRLVVRWAALDAEAETKREAEVARAALREACAGPQGFDAARKALLALRGRNRIGDETLIEMLRETDLAARAAEGRALPGAGPPQPS